MKEITITRYKCEICGHSYDTRKEALSCESKPVIDSSVEVGDIVLITGGEGSGQKAKVTDKFVYDKYWGHYAWERYWHTVGITADIIGGCGSRQLTSDQFKLCQP